MTEDYSCRRSGTTRIGNYRRRLCAQHRRRLEDEKWDMDIVEFVTIIQT
jgi:hypothetical protein